jgi:hypothetical protein
MHASISNQQIGGNPTGVLPVANADVPVRTTGLLSRTGMFPTVGTTGTFPAVHASNKIPDTPAGPLPAHITGQLASSQMDFNGMPLPFQQMPGNESFATATGVFPTASGKQPVVYPSAFNQMSPDLKTTSGSLAVPNYEQGNTGNTVKLTGPVKIVKVPVAGQPGQFVTGLLSVPTDVKPPAAAKSASRKTQVAGLLIALVILLAGGSLGLWYMRGHTFQASPSQNSAQPTGHGAPNLGATALAQATANAQANIILQDPLDQNYHNWPVSTTGSKIYVFKDGAYHITNMGNDGIAVVLQAGPYDQPIGYHMTMQEIKGNDASINNSFGMIIRYSQQTKGKQVINTFYSFEVLNNSHGEYRFYKYDNSKGPSVNPWSMIWHQPFGKEFNQGHSAKSINTVKIFANGSAFTFTVNGKVVGNAKDTSFKTGTVGMLVNLNGTEVAFSNLLITRN